MGRPWASRWRPRVVSEKSAEPNGPAETRPWADVSNLFYPAHLGHDLLRRLHVLEQPALLLIRS